MLLREGIARLLEEAGFEVVAPGRRRRGPAAQGRRRTQPDVAIVDVRMPPTHTDEGLRAAARDPRSATRASACSSCRSTSRTGYAVELLAASAEGVGYLLKDRVADVERFVDAVRRVARAASALDPEVVVAPARPPPTRATRWPS